MLINEMFDNPHDCRDDTEFALSVAHACRAQRWPITGLNVYERVSDTLPEGDHEIFVLIRTGGVWEAHHSIFTGGQYVSGKLLGNVPGPNPRFISTLWKLLNSKLSKGHSIRIIATPVMWPTYEKIAQRMVTKSDGSLRALPVDKSYMGIDGRRYIAQIIEPL